MNPIEVTIKILITPAGAQVTGGQAAAAVAAAVAPGPLEDVADFTDVGMAAIPIPGPMEDQGAATAMVEAAPGPVVLEQATALAAADVGPAPTLVPGHELETPAEEEWIGPPELMPAK